MIIGVQADLMRCVDFEETIDNRAQVIFTLKNPADFESYLQIF